MNDYELGVSTLKSFYDEGSKYNPSLKGLGFIGFIKYINSKSKSFISGLGLGVSFLDDRSKVSGSMIRLAINSKGKIPNRLSYFTQAVINGQTSFNFSDFIEVSKMTASDLANYAEKAGTNIKDGVLGFTSVYKYALYALPVGVILYFTMTLSGKKIVKSLMKKAK